MVSIACGAQLRVPQSSTTYPLPFTLTSIFDANLPHEAGATGCVFPSGSVLLYKNGGASAAPAGTITEQDNGNYILTPTSADTGTLGSLKLHAIGYTPVPGSISLGAAATTGGLLAQNTTYYIVITYSNAIGETTKSAQSSFTTGNTTATNTQIVNSPSAATGGTSWRLYAGTTNTGPYYLQATTAVGTPYTLGTNAYTSATANPPSTNTCQATDPYDITFEVTGVNGYSASSFITGINGQAPPTNWSADAIDSSGRRLIQPGAIDLPQYSPNVLSTMRAFLYVTGSTTSPVTNDLYVFNGIYQGTSTYKSTTLGTPVFCWTDGSAFYLTTTSPGTTGSNYFQTGSGGLANGTYTAQGAATGTPAVTAKGMAALSGFQPEGANLTSNLPVNVLQYNSQTAQTDANNLPKTDVEDIRGTQSPAAPGRFGVDWAFVSNPTTTVNLSSTTVGTATNVTNSVSATLSAADENVLATIFLQAGTAQAGSSTTISLSASANTATNFYQNKYVRIVSGTDQGDIQLIGASALVSGKVVCTVSNSGTFAVAPDTSSVYEVLNPVALVGGDIYNTGLSAAAATWNALTASYTGTGSFGALIGTDVNATISSRGTSNLTQAQVSGGAYPIATDSGGNVKVSTGTGANQMNLSGGNLAGAVPSVTSPVTLGTNEDAAITDLYAMITGSGGGAKFTINALSNGPTGSGSSTVVTSGTAQGGTSNTITLANAASTTNNTYQCEVIWITGGTGAGEIDTVAYGGYVGPSRVATMVAPWAVTPDTSSTYEVLAVLAGVPQSGDVYGALPAHFSNLVINATSGGVRPTYPLYKNQAFGPFEFWMLNAQGNPVANLTVTALRSKDGGTLAACDNAVTAIGGGLYQIMFTANDLNCNMIALEFTATGATPVTIAMPLNQ
jgi:hypothetical protein